MTPGEVTWRFGQKFLSFRERKLFAHKMPVFECGAYGSVPKASLQRLGIEFNNDSYSVGAEIELLGDFRYADYRKCWHAAFQTPVDWTTCFSADYSFGAEDVPGDIRTNWELNRHYQFALLAKSYFVTGVSSYLEELTDLFADWNCKNPFMWGPEWSSPMEESIRLVNWLFAAAFLKASGNKDVIALSNKLCAGAWTMAAHVREHYSRYSSANNHTVVEAAGVAVAATVFGQECWLQEALGLLESEVDLQTYSDGVNKEQALHYQLFVMEAICLVSHVLRTGGSSLSGTLVERLRFMARYVRACCVGEGRYIEFGDDDEGIILNLAQTKPRYPEYVLTLASLELGENLRWVEEVHCSETLEWLYGHDRLEVASMLPLADNNAVESFPEGGITIIRFDKGRAVLAFDHGLLGFGRLAAHGHADALSVQLFVDDEPVFIDPGTFIYNGNSGMRDKFRSTRAHNTVCVDGRNQSEILGPFLWGKKASVSGFSLDESGDELYMAAEHDGYASVRTHRKVEIHDSSVIVADEVGDSERAIAYWHLPIAGIELRDGSAEICLRSGTVVRIGCDALINAAPFEYSPSYGSLAEGRELSVPFSGRLTTTIEIIRGGK